MFKIVYKGSFGIVRFTGAAMMLLLSVCSLTDTWYMLPGGEEISMHGWGSVPGNLLAAALCCILVFGLFRLQGKLGGRVCRILPEVFAALVSLWAFGVCIWWIFSAERPPVGDQAFIYGGASYFRTGNFSFLEPGGYCHAYPYQLGLISLVELLYHVTEPFRYRPLQVINALAVAGTVSVGFWLVREWGRGFCAEVLYCLLMGLCFPLFFYAPWVYGDILSIFLAFLAVFFLCRYGKGGERRCLAGMALALTLAQVVRQSTTIVYVAAVLVAAVYILEKKDGKPLAAVVASAVLSMAVFGGIYQIYGMRSGEEPSKGIPTAVTLAMGMQESRHGCGWDNNYQKDVYNTYLSDYGKMRETGERKVRERLSYFVGNPLYAAEFYGKKILSQWDAPLYQAVFFTADYREGSPPGEGSLAGQVSGPGFWKILGICDRLQFVVYLGMLFWFLWAVKGEYGILWQLPAVAVIGGFCFSLLWEAKTRYVLPYYLMMFPCAAAGYRELLGRAKGVFKFRFPRAAG